MPARVRPRRRAPDERIDQLLDAAAATLIEKGLGATTVADVAEAAGVAKGTLYLYFPSKDALLAGLRSRHLAQFSEAIERGVRPTAPPTRRLERFVDELFRFSIEHQALHHVLFHEAGFSEEDAFAGARSGLASILAAGIDAGEFCDGDPDVTAAFLLPGLHGLLVTAMHDTPTARRAYRATARDLAVRAVTVRSAGG